MGKSRKKFEASFVQMHTHRVVLQLLQNRFNILKVLASSVTGLKRYWLLVALPAMAWRRGSPQRLVMVPTRWVYVLRSRQQSVRPVLQAGTTPRRFMNRQKQPTCMPRPLTVMLSLMN